MMSLGISENSTAVCSGSLDLSRLGHIAHFGDPQPRNQHTAVPIHVANRFQSETTRFPIVAAFGQQGDTGEASSELLSIRGLSDRFDAGFRGIQNDAGD